MWHDAINLSLPTIYASAVLDIYRHEDIVHVFVWNFKPHILVCLGAQTHVHVRYNKCAKWRTLVFNHGTHTHISTSLCTLRELLPFELSYDLVHNTCMIYLYKSCNFRIFFNGMLSRNWWKYRTGDVIMWRRRPLFFSSVFVHSRHLVYPETIHHISINKPHSSTSYLIIPNRVKWSLIILMRIIASCYDTCM